MEHPGFRRQTQINKSCPSAIPICCRQKSQHWLQPQLDQGVAFSWFDNTHPMSTLQATWGRMGKVLRKKEADCFRYQHFPLRPQYYGYYCSMDLLSLPRSHAGAPHVIHTDPPTFQQGLPSCKPGMDTRTSAPSGP